MTSGKLLHLEVRRVEEAGVEGFEVDHRPPTAIFLGDKEQVGSKPWGVGVGHLDSRLSQKGLDFLGNEGLLLWIKAGTPNLIGGWGGKMWRAS